MSWVGQRVYVARESVVAPIALLTVEGIDPGCHQSGVKSVVVARSAVAILETQVCSISILNIYLVKMPARTNIQPLGHKFNHYTLSQQ